MGSHNLSEQWRETFLADVSVQKNISLRYPAIEKVTIVEVTCEKDKTM